MCEIIEKIKLKGRIRWNDWVVGLCFIMALAIKSISIFIFAMITKESGAAIEAVMVAYEANPIMNLAMNLGKIGLISMMIILVPSLTWSG